MLKRFDELTIFNQIKVKLCLFSGMPRSQRGYGDKCFLCFVALNIGSCQNKANTHQITQNKTKQIMIIPIYSLFDYSFVIFCLHCTNWMFYCFYLVSMQSLLSKQNSQWYKLYVFFLLLTLNVIFWNIFELSFHFVLISLGSVFIRISFFILIIFECECISFYV